MAYARFSESSEIFIYGMGRRKGVFCQSCSLVPGGAVLPTRSMALEHLAEHERVGDRVPACAKEGIREELSRFGETADEVFAVRSGGQFECRECELHQWETLVLITQPELSEHLAEHRRAGHIVSELDEELLS